MDGTLIGEDAAPARLVVLGLRLALQHLPLLILLLEVLDAPLKIPVVLSEAVDVREDHILDL